MRNREHARGVFQFEFELPGVDVCILNIVAADSLNARAVALMTAGTDRRTMPATTVAPVTRVISGRVHVMASMCGHHFRFRGQINGHHAGLGGGIQPAKHERAEDESSPRRYRCSVSSCFRQNHPSSCATLDSLDPAGKKGNYLDHTMHETGSLLRLRSQSGPSVKLGADMLLAARVGKRNLLPPFLQALCAFRFQRVNALGAGNAFPVVG